MPVKVDQSRRIWKLQAAKAFASCEPLTLSDIRKAIGQQALDDLFSEVFLTHPDDPVAGAAVIKAKLHKRHGEYLLQSKTTGR